jgi:hypothetical protein
MMKICICCKIEKSSTDFGVNKSRKDGLNYYCKACVSIKDKEKNKKHAERIKVRKAKARQSIDGKYQTYKDAAKTRGMVFDLTKNDFETFWQKPCYYCDAPMKTIGIDRKDNSIGYTLDNCLSCCKICNLGKHTSTYEEYVEHCKRMARKWADAI